MADQQVFLLRGEPIPFRVERKKRKTYRVSVQRDGAILLLAPCHSTDERCLAFLTQSRHWIVKQRALVLALPSPKVSQYVGGESHLYLGRTRRLKIVPAPTSSVRLERSQIVIRMPNHQLSSAVKSALEGWYLSQATEVFQVRLMACLQRSCFDERDRPVALKIKGLKATWGSMSKSGILTLSKDLIKAPIECIDYVITHELCHIRVPGHGPEYWQFLSRAMPDWKRRRQLLEDTLG